MPAVPTQTLVAFAILTSNWDEHGVSYFHNFLPLVAHCLAIDDAEAVSEERVRNRLADEFGIELPRPVIKTILKRAHREGLVTIQNRVYRPIPTALREFDLSRKRSETARELNSLIEAFRSFVKSDFDYDIPPDEAEAALLEYVADRAIPILRSSIRGEAFKPELLSQTQYEYVVGQFVSHAFENDPTNFELLERAVKGSMLAAAMYLPNVRKISERVRDLTVFLDTPFIIALIGYGGEALRDAANELVDLLAQLGARLACYEHTLTETQNVFTSAAGQLRAISRKHASLNAYPPLVEFSLKEGISASELTIQAEQLRDTLSKDGVDTLAVPEITTELSLDELELEDTLQKVVRYNREGARRNDVKSLTAVYRTRNGQTKTSLETAKAIFTTPNSALVRASRHFFDESPRGDQVPISTLDHELATVAWLKSPTSAPNLPRKQLIADCLVSQFPNDELWDRYLGEIERLNDEARFSDEDYFTLRFGIEARRALMHDTKGDAEAFTSGTVQEVLEKARAEHQREALEQLRDAEKRTDEAEVRAHQFESRLSRVEAQLKTQEEEPLRVMRIRSTRLAHQITQGAMWILLAFLLIGGLMAALTSDSAMATILAAAVALASVLGLLNTFFGGTVKDWAARVAGPIGDLIYKSRVQRYRRFIDRIGTSE